MLQVRVRKNSDTADGFVQILYKFQDSKANDPKDKVFAFLGLDEELGTHIDPNYQATIEQTFQNLTTELLHGNSGPEVLSLAGNRHNRSLLTLPSWVPDLTVKLLSQPLGVSDLAYKLYQAGTFAEQQDFTFKIVDERLQLRAIRFDAIVNLATPFPLPSKGSYTYDFARSWFKETMQLLHQSSLSQEADAQLRTLLVDHPVTSAGGFNPAYDPLRLLNVWLSMPDAHNNHESPTGQGQSAMAGVKIRTASSAQPNMLPTSIAIEQCPGANFCSGANLAGTSEAEANSEPEYLSDRELQELYNLLMSVVGFMYGRRFCLLSDKSAGLVPEHSEIGDIVCVVQGARVPYVIRLKAVTEDGTQTYELVGECYIEGLMKGEVQHMGQEFKEIVLV